MTGDADALAANIGILASTVGALTAEIGTLTFDIGALIFDIGALTFDVFGLENKSNRLIYNDLRKNVENWSKIASFRLCRKATVAEYCLRDVKATVELYKIWKERLAGIK